MQLGALVLAIMAASATALLIPKDNNANSRVTLGIMRESTKEALRLHARNPARCSMQQVVESINKDAEARFRAKTGRSVAPPSDVPYFCTECGMTFDDYVGALLHLCST